MTAGEQGAIIPAEATVNAAAAAIGAEAGVGSVTADAELSASEEITNRERLFRQMLAENGDGKAGFYRLADGNVGDVDEGITQLGDEVLTHEREMELRLVMEEGYQVFSGKDPRKDHDALEKTTMARATSAYGELLYHCQRQVAGMARHYAGHVPYADLYQEGNIVVMRSLMRTEPWGFGDRIRSHMAHILEGFMERYVVEWSAPAVHVPTSAEAQVRKLADARAAFMYEHGREPSHEDLLTAAGIHDWRFEELRVLQSMRDAEPLNEADERQMAAAGASSEDDPGAEENIDARLIHEMLGTLMVRSGLTAQEKILLSLRVAAYFPNLVGSMHNDYTYPQDAAQLPMPEDKGRGKGLVSRLELCALLGYGTDFSRVRQKERRALRGARAFLQLYFDMPRYLEFNREPWSGVEEGQGLATEK